MATWYQNFGALVKNMFLKQDFTSENLAYKNSPIDSDPKSFKHRLKRLYKSRSDVEMKTWKRAVAQAEDKIRPRRVELYRLYERSLEDDHLLSQIRTALFTVRMSEFKLLKGKSEADETIMELFERPWFFDFMKYAVESEFWGHSLIEFDSNKEGIEFKRVSIIPREHVRPEYGEIVLSIHDEKGLVYKDGKLSKYLLEIGDNEDLGLLKVLSKIVIRKEYSLVDWSRRNEKFGMPFLILNTTSMDKAELDAKEEMASNFGSNSYAIFDDQDKATLLESNQAFTYQTFKDFGAWADAAIAMLVNGQTGTSEEKAFVGSAQVHERILNTYTKDRMKRIQYIINFSLIPFLIKHGYSQLSGFKFQFVDLLKSTSKPDNMDTPQPPEPQKKKLSLSSQKPGITDTLHHIYNNSVVCCTNEEHLSAHTLTFDVSKMIERIATEVFNKKLKSGDIDIETWQYYVAQLDKALAKSRGGKDLYKTSYNKSTDWELSAQLRNNIFVFAAFKNHQQISDLVNNLTDDQGNLREWEEFKTIANQISKNYFEEWLKAEYNTAVATGQMAARWLQFEENKDTLPSLTYVTQQDARVRDAHKVLDGVTRRVDDPFWDKFYPPNGWNCRCDIIQSADDPTEDFMEPNEEQVPPVFRNNPGKTRKLFADDHPYYETSNAVKKRLAKAIAKAKYNSYGDKWNTVLYSSQNDGYLVSNKYSDAQRLTANTTIGKMLARNGKQVEILPVQEDAKSPDASVDGLLYTFVLAQSVDDALEQIQEDKNRAKRMFVAIDTKLADDLRKEVSEDKSIEVMPIDI